MTDKTLLENWICKYNFAKDYVQSTNDDICRNYWSGKKTAYSGVILEMAKKIRVRVEFDDIGHMVIVE